MDALEKAEKDAQDDGEWRETSEQVKVEWDERLEREKVTWLANTWPANAASRWTAADEQAKLGDQEEEAQEVEG